MPSNQPRSFSPPPFQVFHKKYCVYFSLKYFLNFVKQHPSSAGLMTEGGPADQKAERSDDLWSCCLETWYS